MRKHLNFHDYLINHLKENDENLFFFLDEVINDYKFDQDLDLFIKGLEVVLKAAKKKRVKHG